MSLLKDHDPTWQLEEAEDGVVAIMKAGRLQPEIILLDYHMPKLNGIKAATFIKKASPDSRLILVSMEMSPEVMIETIHAGISGIVSKHSNENELILAIDHVANGKNHYPETVSEMVAMDDKEKQKQVKQSRHTKSKLLTDREDEVFRQIIKGLTASSIARTLFISVRTVNNHKTNIFRKCKVRSTPELIRYAFKMKPGN